MKILFKNRSFGGGAPKSLLAYINIAKEMGHEVLSVGAYNYDPVEYKENDIRTINLPYFKLHKPVHNFRVLMDFLKIIENERPDLIHTTTLYNIYFQHIIEKLTNIPSVYMIPGGQISSFAGKVLSKLMKNKELIVYSEENREELLSYGVDDENINVIPNRIDFDEITLISDPFKVYKGRHKDELIKGLLITRFSDTKIKSIRHVIEMMTKLSEDGIPISLTILGSGFYYDQIREEAELINDKFGRTVIDVPGYKNNVSDYVENAHIIFGKGRSVIDGIMQKKLSAVVNESQQVFVCDSDNFIPLSDYNLTGRNEVEPTSYKEFKQLCKAINANSIDEDELNALYDITQQRYDINVVKKDINLFYERLKNHRTVNYSPSTLRVIREFIVFYVKLVWLLLKK